MGVAKETVRELGFCETVCGLNQERWRGSSQIFVLLRLTGPLTEAALSEALGVLLGRHPLLRASLSAEAGAPYRFHVPAQTTGCRPPMTVTTRATAPAFRADDAGEDGRFMERRAFDPFPEGGLLWHVDAFLGDDGSHALLCRFHHAICDLVSVGLFSHDLMRVLGGLRGDTAPLPLLKNMEAYLVRDGEPPAADGAPALEAPVFPSFDADAPFDQRVTRNVFRTVGADIIAPLRTACAARGVSLEEVLGAAAAMACQGDAGTGARVPLCTVFDGRRFCATEGGAKGSLGNEAFGYFAFVQFSTPQLGADLWDTAHDHQAVLARALAASAGAGYLPDSVDKEALWQGFQAGLQDLETRRIFPSGTAVFLGDVTELRPGSRMGGAYGPYHLQSANLWTAQQTGLFHSTLCGFLIGDCFEACISHPNPLVDRSRAIAAADGFVALLREAAAIG